MSCSHLERVEEEGRSPVEPREQGCEECLAMGAVWVHLRLCMACGHVGCCDESPNKHATAHYRATEHPVIKSFEPGEEWAWCYADELFVDEIPAYPDETPPEHIYPPA